MPVALIDSRLLVLLLRLVIEVVPSHDLTTITPDDASDKYGLRIHSSYLAELYVNFTDFEEPTLDNSIVSSAPYDLSVVCLHCHGAKNIIKSFEINVTRSNGQHLEHYIQTVGETSVILPANVSWRAPELAFIACVNFRLLVNEGNSTYLSHTTRCRFAGCISYHGLSSGSSSSGILKSRDRPSNGTEHSNCTYVLASEILWTVNIQFHDFVVKTANSKCKDYIRVFGSTTDDRPRCGTALGSSLAHLNFQSLGNRLVLVFVFSTQSTSRFNASYSSLLENDCGRNLTSSFGTIHSPNYPQLYFPNTRCVYVILQPLGHRVRVSVTFLEIERDDGGNCTWDYVVARTGHAELRRWCGQKKEYQRHKLIVTSQSARDNISYVEVAFQSNAIGAGRGFVISYIVLNPVCPNAVDISAFGGTLVSPEYPAPYPPGTMCMNSLRSIKNTVIEVTFAVLSTAARLSSPLSGGDCRTDYVDIYDGKDSHRRCGEWKDDMDKLVFRSHGNNLVVRFVSNDDLDTSNGFFATWETVNSSLPLKVCEKDWIDGGNFCLKIIVQYPQNWHNANLICKKNGGYLATIDSERTDNLIQKYLIKRPLDPNQGLWIGANDLTVENDFYWLDRTPVQYTDWFHGWTQYNGSRSQPSDDGLSDEDCVELRGTYSYPHKGMGRADKYYWNDRQCGAKNGFICQIDTMKAKVQLETQVCDLEITLNDLHDSETFTSSGYPNKYSNLLDCHTDIISPVGTQILIEFAPFHLETDTNCRYDFVSIAPIAHTSKTFVDCGVRDHSEKNVRLLSQENRMHVHFHTDESFVFKGYVGKVSVFNSSDVIRTTNTETALEGLDSSSNYPNQNYSSNVVRTIKLALPRGYRILINITFIDIEYHSQCIYDSLTIADTNAERQNSVTVCGWLGMNTVNSFVSETNDVTITFATDSSVSGRGYELTWQGQDMSKCNQTIHVLGNTKMPLKSLNHVMSYFNNLDCYTNLVAKKGYRVLVEFEKFGFAISATIPCADYINITLSNNSAPIQLCPETGFETHGNRFLSEHDFLSLHFHSDETEESSGYRAVYSQVNTMIQDLTKVVRPSSSTMSSVHSVNFNIGFLNHVTQTLIIMAPLGKNVIITIRRLIPTERYSECGKVKLDIRDFLLNKTTPLLSLDMCNTSLTDYSRPLTSLLHAVTVRMQSSNILVEHAVGYLVEFRIIEDAHYLGKSIAMMAGFSSCRSQPCQHNSTCVKTNDGFAKCKCAGPYTGMLCQSKWCDLTPCNNGTCYHTMHFYSCVCHEGLWGKACNMTSNECDKKVCGNNGVCKTLSNNDTSCLCKEDFTGVSCMEKVKEQRQETIVEKLLDEPIWIGIIAIISVMILYCFFYCIGKRCEQHLDCCNPTKKILKEQKSKISMISSSNIPLGMDNPLNSSDSNPVIVIDEIEYFEPASPLIDETNQKAAAKIHDAFKWLDVQVPKQHSLFASSESRATLKDNPTFLLCSEDINTSSEDDRRSQFDPSGIMRRSFGSASDRRFPPSCERVDFLHTNSLDDRMDSKGIPKRSLKIYRDKMAAAKHNSNKLISVSKDQLMYPMERDHIQTDRYHRPIYEEDYRTDSNGLLPNSLAGGNLNLDVGINQGTSTDNHNVHPTKAEDRRKVFAMKAKSFNTPLVEDNMGLDRPQILRSNTKLTRPSFLDMRPSYGSLGLPLAESGYGSQSLDRLKYLADSYSVSVENRNARLGVSILSTNGNQDQSDMKDEKDSSIKKVRKRKKFRRHTPIDIYQSSSNSDEHRSLRQITRHYGVSSIQPHIDWDERTGQTIVHVHVHKEQGEVDYDGISSKCYPDGPHHSPNSEETSGSGRGSSSGSGKCSIISGGENGIPHKQTRPDSKIETDSAFSSTNSKSIQTSPMKCFTFSEFTHPCNLSIPSYEYGLDQSHNNTPNLSDIQTVKDSAYQTKEPSTDIAPIPNGSNTSSPVILQQKLASFIERRKHGMPSKDKQRTKLVYNDTTSLLQRVTSKLRQIEYQQTTSLAVKFSSNERSSKSSEDSYDNQRKMSSRRSAWNHVLNPDARSANKDGLREFISVRRHLTPPRESITICMEPTTMELQEFNV